MTILVFVKRVVDPYVRVRVNSSGTGIDGLMRGNGSASSGISAGGIKMAMNPFDAIALEAALQLKASAPSTLPDGSPLSTSLQTVHIASFGDGLSDAGVTETLRQGLAMGADKAHLITLGEGCADAYHDPSQLMTPLDRAKLFVSFVEGLPPEEKPDLILMGKQAIDDDAGQVPPMMAGLLGWPQATFASKLTLLPSSQSSALLEVEREVDGGIDILQVSFPAVVSVDLRLNEPRLAALPAIMKAKMKPCAVVAVSMPEAGESHHCAEADLGSGVSTVRLKSPSGRQRGAILPDVPTLVKKLKERGVL